MDRNTPATGKKLLAPLDEDMLVRGQLNGACQLGPLTACNSMLFGSCVDVCHYAPSHMHLTPEGHSCCNISFYCMANGGSHHRSSREAGKRPTRRPAVDAFIPFKFMWPGLR